MLRSGFREYEEEILRFPACCRQKNAIFYLIFTEPRVHHKVHPCGTFLRSLLCSLIISFCSALVNPLPFSDSMHLGPTLGLHIWCPGYFLHSASFPALSVAFLVSVLQLFHQLTHKYFVIVTK